jgi:hypothetical protein
MKINVKFLFVFLACTGFGANAFSQTNQSLQTFDTSIIQFTYGYRRSVEIHFSNGKTVKMKRFSKRKYKQNYYNDYVCRIAFTEGDFELSDSLGNKYTQVYFKVIYHRIFKSDEMDADYFILYHDKNFQYILFDDVGFYGTELFKVEVTYSNKRMRLR